MADLPPAVVQNTPFTAAENELIKSVTNNYRPLMESHAHTEIPDHIPFSNYLRQRLQEDHSTSSYS